LIRPSLERQVLLLLWSLVLWFWWLSAWRPVSRALPLPSLSLWLWLWLVLRPRALWLWLVLQPRACR
jgi:hypothetical protein